MVAIPLSFFESDANLRDAYNDLDSNKSVFIKILF
jgi:hypothetical protein